MNRSSGEFRDLGSVGIAGWGAGIEIRSHDSIRRLHRAVHSAASGERWAAILPMATRRERRRWTAELERSGLRTRPLDPRCDLDPECYRRRGAGAWLMTLLALPAALALRVSGRRTEVLVVGLPDDGPDPEPTPV